MAWERTYLVAVVAEDSGGSTVVEKIDRGGLLDIVGGCWGFRGGGDSGGCLGEPRRVR